MEIKMEQILLIEFLKSFFFLFKAKVEEYKIFDKNIYGIVGWHNEDDKQKFVFKNEYDVLLLSKARILCDYLSARNLINGDKITITEIELIQQLNKNGWNEIEAKDAINFLCEFDVKMIDDEEETDSFFVHF
jgi:hypothetical protein